MKYNLIIVIGLTRSHDLQYIELHYCANPFVQCELRLYVVS